MLIARKSPHTGEVNTREIDVTQAQLNSWMDGDGHIQNIMPLVPAEDREFLMTGLTPEDWLAIFGKEE